MWTDVWINNRDILYSLFIYIFMPIYSSVLILSHFSRRQRRIRRPDKLILLTQTPPPPFFLDSGSPLVRFFFWILFYFDLLVKKKQNTMNDDLSIVSWRVSCRQHFWLSSIPSLLEYFSSHSITLRINIICLFSPTKKETIGIFVLFYLFLCETQKTEYWVAKTKVFFFHGIKKKTTDRETWQFFFFPGIIDSIIYTAVAGTEHMVEQKPFQTIVETIVIVFF